MRVPPEAGHLVGGCYGHLHGGAGSVPHEEAHWSLQENWATAGVCEQRYRLVVYLSNSLLFLVLRGLRG